jgi:sugar O-acyltransferase (sialic acid O-acetyltransferase NeuD family)
MKDLVIFGNGGFGREVQMLIEQINEVTPSWNILGYYDDDDTKVIINGLPYLGSYSDLKKVKKDLAVVFAIGNPEIKESLILGINSNKIYYPTLIHPSVIHGRLEYLKLGVGVVICAGCLLTTNIVIGDHVILNLACTVGHDTIIKDFCSFMPSVNISGDMIIERKVYIGTGAKLINGITIGENSTIGAGSVVVKDLPSNCVAVGSPARIIKYNNE